MRQSIRRSPNASPSPPTPSGGWVARSPSHARPPSGSPPGFDASRPGSRSASRSTQRSRHRRDSSRAAPSRWHSSSSSSGAALLPSAPCYTTPRPRRSTCSSRECNWATKRPQWQGCPQRPPRHSPHISPRVATAEGRRWQAGRRPWLLLAQTGARRPRAPCGIGARCGAAYAMSSACCSILYALMACRWRRCRAARMPRLFTVGCCAASHRSPPSGASPLSACRSTALPPLTHPLS